LVLSYQGLEKENFVQKSPGPPGWGLMQRAKKPNTKPRGLATLKESKRREYQK
jgi:hypothetical protein